MCRWPARRWAAACFRCIRTSTLSGNPLGMVAAQAAIAAIRDEDLVWRSRWIGELLLEAVERSARCVNGGSVQ